MANKKPGFIRRSLGFIGRLISWLRLAVVNLAFIAMLVVLYTLLSGREMPVIPERGALVLEPRGTVVEQLSVIDPFVELMGDNNPRDQETRLQDMIDAVNQAKDDERITSIVIKTDNLMRGGLSKIQELAEAVTSFRESGKKVIAVADSYNQDQYLLAVQADEIYMNPMGQVLLQGFGVYRSYFKEALEKLSVNFHVFRVGSYKSAMEPFLRNDMSKEAKQANSEWLAQLWSYYIDQVASRRAISLPLLNRYVNEPDHWLSENQGNAAALAVEAGLIDGLKTRDEMQRYLVEIVGAESEKGIFQGVDFERYLWLKNLEVKKQKLENKPEKVGVIVASGNIVAGQQPPGTIGADTLSELIQQAKSDDAIKAVVLRVDSGGGSAFASEVIRQELKLLKAAGKPLVVSMGSVAASGGYWISALADSIFATPTTLTGSIGIFGAFPTVEKSLEELGVHNDGVGTTALAGAMRIDRPLNPVMGRSIQLSIEHGYQQFLEVVAEGRGMTATQVAEIAEGRVWSGMAAHENGLVDELGSLQAAVKQAARLAELEHYEQQLIELPLSPKELFLRQLGQVKAQFTLANTWATLLPAQWRSGLQPFTENIAFIQTMNDPLNRYLHCSPCVAP